jgi:hypothetical protein
MITPVMLFSVPNCALNSPIFQPHINQVVHIKVVGEHLEQGQVDTLVGVQ